MSKMKHVWKDIAKHRANDATQFFTHLFDKIFGKSKNSKKQ